MADALDPARLDHHPGPERGPRLRGGSGHLSPRIRKLRRRAAAELEAAGVPFPRGEADELLAYVLGIPRRELDASGAPPPPEAVAALEALVARRAAGEPRAYLLGHKRFFDLEVLVGPGTMIPRPDTEVLVEAALERIPEDEGEARGFRVLDVGTGSGCVALALRHHRPAATVVALELTWDALAVARRNLEPRGVPLVQGDLLAPVATESLDLVVGNPPYLDPARTDGSRPDLHRQPEVAFVAGDAGLGCLERLIRDAPRVLRPGGTLLVEHACDQGAATRTRARAAGMEQVVTLPDLSGLDRCLEALRPCPL